MALLADSKTITWLNVGENRIGYEGARALANSKTITNLNLWQNEIRDIGAKALSKSKILLTYDVTLNNISKQMLRKLHKQIAQNNTNYKKYITDRDMFLITNPYFIKDIGKIVIDYMNKIMLADD